MTRATDDLARLKAALADRADQILVELFGEPTKRRAREWRWGRWGSLSFDFRKMVIYDHERQRGGSLLDAICIALSCSIADAIAWAERWIGVSSVKQHHEIVPRPPLCNVDVEAKIGRSEARALWGAGVDVTGTLAATYSAKRGIDRCPAQSVRFIDAGSVAKTLTRPSGRWNARRHWDWWRWPAIMFAVTGLGGEVEAVQLVALNEDGTAVPHWDDPERKIKMTRGPLISAAVRFPGTATEPLLLAEGPETALSVWLPMGWETWSMIGGIGRAPLNDVPLSKIIVVCRDDDPHDAPSRTSLKDAVRQWRSEGRTVVEAQPWELAREDKSDFNDVLQACGEQAVRARIEAALTRMACRVGVACEDATVELRRAVRLAVDDLLSTTGLDSPSFHLIRATLGLGKTEEALRALVPTIAAGTPMVYSAPAHRLTGELERRVQSMARAMGHKIKVTVWRGREQPNPLSPGQTMCLDIEAVTLGQQAGVSVRDTICARCAHREDCRRIGYEAQAHATADLWIVPHALLFTEQPPTMRSAKLLVIDEAIALSGIRPNSKIHVDELSSFITQGHGTRRRRVPAWLPDEPKPSRTLEELSADLNEELRPIHLQLVKVAAAHPASRHGVPLEKAALSGITYDEAERARELNRKRHRLLGRLDMVSRDDMLTSLQRIAAENRKSRNAGMLWRCIRDFLADKHAEQCGRVFIIENNKGERSFGIRTLDGLGKGWRSLPVLHLDATGRIQLLKHRFAQATLVADIVAAEPSLQIEQVVSETFSKASLVELNGRPRRLASAVRRDILARTAGKPGRYLVVTHKELAEEWRRAMPAHVEVGWFGNLRGLDAYGDATAIFIVGRWGLEPNEAASIAGIVSGRAVSRMGGWYPSRTVNMQAADGTTLTVDADCHPDPLAEEVRQAVVVDELLQVIGRGRAVRRGPEFPLHVVVYGNTPLPLPLAKLTDWQPPDFERSMVGELGVWLEPNADAATATGWSEAAVEKARQRRDGGRLQKQTSPKKKISLSKCLPLPWAENTPAVVPGLAVATYRRAGARFGQHRMEFDPVRIGEPRAWLEALLGALAHFALMAASAPEEKVTFVDNPQNRRDQVIKHARNPLQTLPCAWQAPPGPPERFDADDNPTACCVPVALPEALGSVGEALDYLVEAHPGTLPVSLDGDPSPDPLMDEALDWLSDQIRLRGILPFESLEPIDPTLSTEETLHKRMRAEWRDRLAWHRARHDLTSDVAVTL